VFWTPREVLFIEDETQALLRVPGKSNVIAGALRDLVWMGRLKLPAPDGEPTP